MSEPLPQSHMSNDGSPALQDGHAFGPRPVERPILRLAILAPSCALSAMFYTIVIAKLFGLSAGALPLLIAAVIGATIGAVFSAMT